MQANILLSEYLKKWYYIYKPISYTFSQSYNIAVKGKEKHRQWVVGWQQDLRVYDWVDFAFLELDEVDSRHSLDD